MEIYIYICIWKEGWVNARMMDGRTDGPTDTQTDGWTDGGRCKGEGMDGEMKGWVGEKMSESTHG